MKFTFFPLLLAVAFFFSCNNSPKTGSTLTDLDAGAFLRVMDSLPVKQVLDVRTPEEFAANHIANAINADWNGADFAAATKGLSRDKPVMVYCLSGGRSKEAAKWLSDKGFTTVYQLSGGLRSWQTAGFPVQKGNGALPYNSTLSTAAYTGFINANKIVLVDFSATWCGPCQHLAPKLEQLLEEKKGKFVLLKSDVDRDSPLADSMHIVAMPTLILYKNGVNVWRTEGDLDKETIAAEIDKVQ